MSQIETVGHDLASAVLWLFSPMSGTHANPTALSLDSSKPRATPLIVFEQAQFFPYLLGYVAFYGQNYKTAASEELSKANQNDPFIQCLVGQTYEKLGEKDKAIESYRKATAGIAHNPPAAYAVPFAKKRLASI